MNLLWFMFPFIVLLGIVTSYQDIKTKKIRNKWIITALIVSLVMHVILFSLGITEVEYGVKLGTFVFFSFVIGVFLYMFGLWSAGDAKLFTAYVSLIPLSIYQKNSTSFHPLGILINTFVPLFVVLVIYLLVKTSKEQKVEVIKNSFNLKRIGNYLLTIFSISWITHYLFVYFGVRTNIVLNMFAIMAIKHLLRKIWPNEINLIMVVLSLSRVFFNREYILTAGFLREFILMTTAYGLFIFMINDLGSLFQTKINVRKLKPGMVLVEKKYIEKVRINLRKGYYVNNLKVEGLTEEDIAKIKDLYKRKKIKNKYVFVQQEVPFALFLFLGVLLTLILKGSLNLL